MANSSIHKDILDAFVTEIQALSLTGISSANIKALKMDKEQYRQDLGAVPGVAVFHEDEGEEHDEANGGTLYNYIGFPVNVVMVDEDRGTGAGATTTSSMPDQILNHDRNLYWRERILKNFLAKRITSTTIPVCTITLVSREIMVLESWREAGLWVSPLSFLAWIQLPRN